MYKRYYWLLVITTISYLLFTAALPPNPTTLAHYNITPLQLQLLGISILVPVIIIWLAAFYGFIHFEDYADRIKKSPDGHGLKAVADGLLLLAVGLVVPSLISSILQYGVYREVISQAASTVINTHFALVFPFVGFLLVLIGAQRLLKTIPKLEIPMRHDLLVAFLTIAIGLTFALLTLQNPARTVATVNVSAATYYLPDWLIITTIVVPYVIVWSFGLFAALRLHVYQQNVPGKAYRLVLRTLERGIIAVIVTSIGIQFLSTATTGLNSLGFGWVVVLLYALFALIAIGYILIASSARKLKTLEELT